jgi:hypothetical protein
MKRPWARHASPLRVMPSSGQNRIHPSGESIMPDKFLFLRCIRCFRHGQPRNLGSMIWEKAVQAWEAGRANVAITSTLASSEVNRRFRRDDSNVCAFQFLAMARSFRLSAFFTLSGAFDWGVWTRDLCFPLINNDLMRADDRRFRRWPVICRLVAVVFFYKSWEACQKDLLYC